MLHEKKKSTVGSLLALIKLGVSRSEAKQEKAKEKRIIM